MDQLPPSGASLLRRTPFIGREAELDGLTACLDAARQGAGGALLISGEPGIGKTRLLGELAERARDDGWMVLEGRAYQAEGMPPYLPLVDALRGYVRTAPAEVLRAQLGEGAADVALLIRDLRGRIPDLPAPAAISTELERYRLFESVTDFLIAIAWGSSQLRASSSTGADAGRITRNSKLAYLVCC